MSLDEKLKYYDYYCEYGFWPNNIVISEMFDEELLNALSNVYMLRFDKNILEYLLSNEKLSYNTLNLILNARGFYELDYTYLIEKVKNDERIFNEFRMILKDLKVIRRAIQNIIKQSSIATSLIDIAKINDELYKFLISIPEFFYSVIDDEYFVSKFLDFDCNKFFDIINNMEINLKTLAIIDKKINSLKDKELITLLSTKYNESENTPFYLEKYYLEHKEEIIKFKIRKTINLNENNSKEIIFSSIGLEAMMEVLEPKFSQFIASNNLNPELCIKRKEYLYGILAKYDDYTIDSIKNVFCAYYFERSTNDVLLDLKTVIEYSEKNKDAYNIIGENIRELKEIYAFLKSDEINIDPVKLVTISNIAEYLNNVVNKMHGVFKCDVEKAISLNQESINKRENTDVDIYDLSNDDFENPYFLIHSMCINCNPSEFIEIYTDFAIKHNKICTSLLNKSKKTTFNRSENTVVFGYNKIHEYLLYSALTCDAQTNQRGKKLLRQYASHLSSINEFMNCTENNSYNEIAFLLNGKVLFPDYILCIDKEPSSLEISLAQELSKVKKENVPIYVFYPKNVVIQEESQVKIREAYDYATDFLIVKKSISMNKGQINEINSSR